MLTAAIMKDTPLKDKDLPQLMFHLNAVRAGYTFDESQKGLWRAG